MADGLTVTFGGTVNLVLQPPPPQGKVIVTATCNRFTAKGTDMAYTLADGNQVRVRVDYVDAHGHPAQVDGDVVWDTSSADIVTVTVDPTDSHSALVVPANTLGTAQVSATADADLGAGTKSIVTPFDVTVVAGEAVAGVISPVGDAEPIPAAAASGPGVGPATASPNDPTAAPAPSA